MYNPGSDLYQRQYSDSHLKAHPGYPPAQPDPYPPPKADPFPPPQPMGSGYPPPVHQQPTSTMHNTNTTVVIQQQPAAVVVGAPDWSSGLCACFDDCGVCILGFCSCLLCLPIIECQVSAAAGECCCVGACCPIALRTKIRTKYNIQGSIMEDCCVLAHCHYCAFCQMQRELKARNGMP